MKNKQLKISKNQKISVNTADPVVTVTRKNRKQNYDKNTSFRKLLFKIYLILENDALKDCIYDSHDL